MGVKPYKEEDEFDANAKSVQSRIYYRTGWRNRQDVLRRRIRQTLMRSISGGVKTYSAKTVFPSKSVQAWGAMFHGVGPLKHELGSSNPCPEDVPWPSFMKLLHQERPGSRLASFSCWEPINSKIIERSCGGHRVSMPDLELADAASEYIRNHPPDMFFMQLDHTDSAGHTYGYGTTPYLEQIAVSDTLVGLVIDAIKDAGVFDESLIVVLSDHGGKDKSHGSNHPDCMSIFWSCRGHRCHPGRRYRQPRHHGYCAGCCPRTRTHRSQRMGRKDSGRNLLAVAYAVRFADRGIAMSRLIQGCIRTESGRRIAGVSVSNGREVVRTDIHGGYQLACNPEHRFVFMTVPAGYVAVDRFYIDLKNAGDFDFTLRHHPKK